MKILRIFGQNLASLESFDVNFESAPLAAAGLFAITGPTGAGKSTILDALCVALYDKTPRLAGRGVAIPDPGGTVIAGNDVRSLLRRGAGSGYAEVHFVGTDGERYGARWTVRRAREKANGALQQSEMAVTRLADAQAQGKANKGQTLEFIESMIGLTFEQFRRAVLLAQGEFAALLKADANDRAALLERMTGTEIYGLISTQAFHESRMQDAVAAELKRRADEINALTVVERAAVEGELQTSIAASTEATADATRAQAATNWHKTRTDLAAKLDAASGRSAEAQRALDDATPRAKELAAVEAAEAHRAAYKDADAARHEAGMASAAVNTLEGDVTTATAGNDAARNTKLASEQTLTEARAAHAAATPLLQRARELDTQLQEAEARFARAKTSAKTGQTEAETARQKLAAAEKVAGSRRTELTASEAWLAARPTDAALAAQWPAWKPVIEDAIHLGERRADIVTSREEANRVAVALNAALDAAKSAEATRRTTYEAALTAATEAESRVDAGEAAVISELATQAQTRLDRLASLRSISERAMAVGTRATIVANELRTESSHAASEADKAQLARAAENTLTARIDESARALRTVEAAVDLADRRHELRDGEPCSLCGALDHPWARGDAPGQSLVAEQRKRLAELRAESLVVHGTIKAATEGERRALEQVARGTKEQDALTTELAGLHARWASEGAHEIASGLTAEPAEALEELSARHTSLTNTKAALAARDREFRERQTTAQKARVHATATTEQWHVAKNRFDAAETDARSAQANAQRLADAVTELHRQLARVEERAVDLEVLRPGAIIRLRAEPARLRDELAELAQAFTTEASRRDQLAKLADTAAHEQQLADANHARLNETAQKLAADAAGEESALRGHQGQRAGLLGGRAADEVERELTRRTSGAESDTRKATDAATEASNRLVSISARLDAAKAHAATAGEAHRRTASRLDQALAELGVDLATLTRRLAHGAPWVRAEREALDRLKGAVEVARALVASQEAALAAHDAKDRPDLDGETARALAGVANTRRTEADQRAGTLRSRLQHDDTQRVRRASLDAQRTTHEQKRLIWSELNTLIGSSQGDKFRKFAQSLTLDLLLAYANHHLRDLSHRYTLQRVQGAELELQIQDGDMADEIRSLATLSGGETFLVSLALALGLASLSARTTTIESLFIDEGFGTLDPDTLETALSVLDSLQSTGRKVGLISHVQGMSDRLGVRVEVRRRGAGRSTVHVVQR